MDRMMKFGRGVRSGIQLLAIGGCLTVCGAHAAHAQDGQSESAATAFETIVNIQFGGGTLAEYVEMLRDAYPRVNVLLTGDCENALLSAVSLRNVTMNTALNLLDGRVMELAGRDVQLAVELRVTEGVVEEEPVWIINCHDVSRAKALEVMPVYRVWSIRNLVAESSISQDDLFGAVEAAIELSYQSRLEEVGNGSPLDMSKDNQRVSKPVMKFHEGSGLLIVRGQPEDLMIIEEVFNAVTGVRVAGVASPETAAVPVLTDIPIIGRLYAERLAEAVSSDAALSSRDLAMRTYQSVAATRESEVQDLQELVRQLQSQVEELKAQLEAERAKQSEDSAAQPAEGRGQEA